MNITRTMLIPVCIILQASISILGKYFLVHSTDQLGLYITYLGSILLMGIYAVLWQFVLRWTPLSIASSAMSLVPLLTFLGGLFFFNEQVSMQNYVGITLASVGLIMISLSQKGT